MQCTHPIEERQRAFAGTLLPLADRTFCGLCGELVYQLVAARQPVREDAELVPGERPARRTVAAGEYP